MQKSTKLNLHIYQKKISRKKDRKIVIFLFLILNFVSLLCRKPKVIMIMMLINLSKLLLCTTLKSFYAVKKVKQTKKKKRNSPTANHICIDLQFMILKCAALQKLFVIGPFLQFRYCNCCCCNVKPYKFVNADTYIHTILNLSQ